MKNLSKITKYKLALLLPIVLFCGTLLFCSCTKPEPAAPQFHRHLSELITYVSDCVGEFPAFPDWSKAKQLQYNLQYQSEWNGHSESVTQTKQFGGIGKIHNVELYAGEGIEPLSALVWQTSDDVLYLSVGTGRIFQVNATDLPELQLPAFSVAEVPNVQALFQDLVSTFSGMITEDRIHIATGIYDIPNANGAKSDRITLTLNTEDMTRLTNVFHASAVENGLSALCDTDLFALLEQANQLTWSFYAAEEQTIYTQLILTDKKNADLARVGLSMYRKDNSFQWTLAGTVGTRQFSFANEQTNRDSGKSAIMEITYRDVSSDVEAEGRLIYTTTLPFGESHTNASLEMSVTVNGQRTEYVGPVIFLYRYVPSNGPDDMGVMSLRLEYGNQSYRNNPYMEIDLSVYEYEEPVPIDQFIGDQSVQKLSELDPQSDETIHIAAVLYERNPLWMKARYPVTAARFTQWSELPAVRQDAIQTHLRLPGTEIARLILNGKGFGSATFIREFDYTDEKGTVHVDLGNGETLTFIYDPQKNKQVVSLGGIAFDMKRNDQTLVLNGQELGFSGYLGYQLHMEFYTSYIIHDRKIHFVDPAGNTVSYPISVSNDRITIGDTSYTWNVSQP